MRRRVGRLAGTDRFAIANMRSLNERLVSSQEYFIVNSSSVIVIFSLDVAGPGEIHHLPTLFLGHAPCSHQRQHPSTNQGSDQMDTQFCFHEKLRQGAHTRRHDSDVHFNGAGDVSFAHDTDKSNNRLVLISKLFPRENPQGNKNP